MLVLDAISEPVPHRLALIADKLREHFPGRSARTFALRDTVLTQRLRLTRAEAQRLEPRQLWSRVAAELRSTGIDLATTKVLGFLTGPALDGGHVWQGGGGLALCSAACLFSWPRSVPEIVPRFCDGRAAPEWADTSGRGTRWACLSTTLGAAAHELCHALDLGHAEHGLMGRAYDELWRYCVLSTEGATGGLRRPPPELPTVPGVPAGHRCDADCHSRAAPCPPATSDLTFLDAASAALLYHHAWCGAAEGADGPGTVQISPQLEVVSSRPLRVVVCRTADEEAKLVGLWTLSGEDYRLDLGPWFHGVVVDFRDANSAMIGRNTKPTSPDVSEERLEKPSGNLSDTAAAAPTAGSGHSHTHGEGGGAEELHSLVGLALVSGFILMLLVDQCTHRHSGDQAADPEGRGPSRPGPNMTATVGLVVHAAADGVALGAAVASKRTDVELIVFVAIMLHKAPAAFGLVTFLLHEGLERARVRRHLLVFSVAAPLMALLTFFGIGQGGGEALADTSATGLCLLFSAGTFLYVSTVHVLPEVISRGDPKTLLADRDGLSGRRLPAAGAAVAQPSPLAPPGGDSVN
ncbi:Zinc transporter ZIP9 [Amphibalanus amphitrite]|uniref:Zinc transporter ZIP9 n=1 Tax=Amphibalanus amphitrite TaxID=1232801 RepID=A0A6A4VLJ7_AMPAM|nr:Zinc transporter ZIP9 [Amphibalanus amphitrite]